MLPLPQEQLQVLCLVQLCLRPSQSPGRCKALPVLHQLKVSQRKKSRGRPCSSLLARAAQTCVQGAGAVCSGAAVAVRQRCAPAASSGSAPGRLQRWARAEARARCQLITCCMGRGMRAVLALHTACRKNVGGRVGAHWRRWGMVAQHQNLSERCVAASRGRGAGAVRLILRVVARPDAECHGRQLSLGQAVASAAWWRLARLEQPVPAHNWATTQAAKR